MTPKSGAIRRKYNFRLRAETEEAIQETLDLQASEPEIGEVAVTRSNAGAAHEQAIDRSDQPTENGAGRGEVGGSNIGHLDPFPGERRWAALGSGIKSRHTRYQ